MTAAKILAVDDEPDFESLLTQRFRRQIRAQEFAFRFAHHGEEALALLDAEPDIELLLLDINMPVMMVTAYGDDERRRLAEEYGAIEFVTKPVDFEFLKGQLRQFPSGTV